MSCTAKGKIRLGSKLRDILSTCPPLLCISEMENGLVDQLGMSVSQKESGSDRVSLIITAAIGAANGKANLNA